MTELFRRLRYLLQRRRQDQELASEMEFHREMAERDGAPRFGNSLRLREESRETWGLMWLDRLGQDLRYAFRTLLRSPGFTLTAILVLALGIGVNVAAFGFFNLMALRPLPVRDPATLIRIHRRAPGSFSSNMPYPMMSFYREHARTLSAVLASAAASLHFENEDKPVDARFVTANFFSELGAAPKLGRLLDPNRDGAASAEPVAVLSHAFWQRRLGSDPNVVGRTIRLSHRTATVIGIAAENFSGLRTESPDLWSPIQHQPLFVKGSVLLTEFAGDGKDGDAWGGRGVETWGRLQPGVTPQAAADGLAALATELRRQHPLDVWEKEAPETKPGAYAANIRPQEYPLLALMAALSLLILSVSCSNLGSLLLARGVARDREISIRVSVGAGQARLVRQLFTESLVLALLGSAAGLLLGLVATRGLLAYTDAPVWLDPAPDWRVVTFALVTGLLAAVIFGLTPALQVARQRHRASFLRQFMIGAQVAASCILLIVAGLLVRALDHATYADPGFAYDRVITVQPDLASHGYTADQARVYLETLEQRLRAMPGVQSVSLAATPPLGRRTTKLQMVVNGQPLGVHMNKVAPDFFATMTVPLRSGRALQRGDTRAAVVSASLAQNIWPGQNPLGRPFTLGADEYTIVGVAANARLVGLEDSDASTIYFPATPGDLPSLMMLIKTSAPPSALLPAVKTLALSLDPQLFPQVQLLQTDFRRKILEAERGAAAVSLLGLSALFLACLGIVGMVAYAVSQRTKEIGIRIALGARPAHVIGSVLWQFWRPVSAGLVVGVGGAAALSQLLRRVLFGVSHLDPLAYAAAIGLFVLTAALAAWWPARRALRVDPITALRQA